MLARCVHVSRVYANTVDEPYHIGSAMVLWESKRLVVGAQHPPLVRWVVGAALAAQGVQYPEAKDEYVIVEYPGFGIGQQILFSGQLPYWRIVTTARHAVLIFPAIALFYVYRLGRYLFNPLVAMLATVFFSFDPTLIAHSSLVGTDVAGCAGFVAALYYGIRWIAKPQAARGAVFGLVLGLAIASKFSCLLLIPILLFIALMRRRRLPRLRSIALVCAIAFVAVWGTYGFQINQMRQQALFEESDPAWVRLPAIVREMPIPMPSFWLGQYFLATRASQGHATYLNGQVSYDGWRMYFPEALAVKEPIGFLLALIVAIALLVRRPRLLRAWLLLIPIVIYLAISMISKYQLGIRHLLPILPLMYLFAAMQFMRVRREAALLFVMLLAMIETAAIHPDYLAFFIVASGGSIRGDRLLIDSNLDWGQDMGRLANYLRSYEVQGRPYSIRCAYATAPLLKELDLDPAALSGKPHGLFAISKNVLHRLELAEHGSGGMTLGEDYSWVSRYPLVKRIGYSIDVYDLDAKDSPPK
jgi:hypothetical protein